MARQTNRLRIRLRTVKFAIQKLRPSIAFALMLWCAGAGCMLVGYAHAGVMSAAEKPDAHTAVHSVSAAASGSMGAMHTCCKARHTSLNRDARQIQSGDVANEPGRIALPESPTESGVMSCCPLKTGSILVASRSQTSDSAAAPTQDRSADLFVTSSTPVPLAVPLRLLNQSRSYLLDCSFLI